MKLSIGKKLKVTILNDRSRDSLSFPAVRWEEKQKTEAVYDLKLSGIWCVHGNTSDLKGFQRNRFKFQMDGPKAVLHGDLKLFYQTPEPGKSS